MESPLPENPLIRELATRHRVVLLGGMAVIAHGLSRETKDFDVWLEPFGSAAEWADKFSAVCRQFPDMRLWSLARRCSLPNAEVADEIGEFGVLRAEGFDLPVDVFRKPNGMDADDFERVWVRSAVLQDGVRLPEEMDLHQTKAGTSRNHDWSDQSYLESSIKARFRARLPICDAVEALSMMERYADPEVLGFALENRHAEVRDYALKILHEFEAEGDPYSRDILAAWRQRTG